MRSTFLLTMFCGPRAFVFNQTGEIFVPHLLFHLLKPPPPSLSRNGHLFTLVKLHFFLFFSFFNTLSSDHPVVKQPDITVGVQGKGEGRFQSVVM